MTGTKSIKWGLLVLLVMVLCLQPVLGQVSGRGEVRGVVRDQNQAVIPGADVTVVNTATNLTFNTITSEVGNYFIGAVPVGQYSMKVEMPGFNTWTTQFALQTGSTVTIDAELQVGDISTSIEVTDTVSEVSIDRLEVADVKDFARIQQLPLNGRSVTTLFELTPGVEGGGSPRVLGMKVGSTEMTLDGVSLVDRFGGGMARVQPGLDSIQEFRIETVGSDARFSRPSTVTLVSRSGSNELHGSAYWTHRNNAIGLARTRAQPIDFGPAKLIRHEFGATAGGPFWLGNLYDGRDKTFWFFNYEGLRTNESRRTGFRYVPLPEWWTGDLSSVIDGNGVQSVIYNPYTTKADGTRDPFPGNIIPSSMIHPVAARFQRITESPNKGGGINPAYGENFELFYPQTNDSNLWTIKADQVLSERDNLSVRYTRSTRNYAVVGGVYGNPPPEAMDGTQGGSSRNDATVTNVAVNWNSAVSPSFLNELLVGVFRTWKSSGTLADFTDKAGELGFPNPFNTTGWPTIYADCTSNWRTCGWDGDNRKEEPQTHVTVEDNVTWVKGDHVLQLGGKAKIEHDNVRELQQAQGSHSLGKSWTQLYDPVAEDTVSYTGDGFGSLLLGLGDYFSNQYNRGYFYFRQNEYGLFVNDKWKVTPKLTVNLGLRWDAWTPYREKQDRLSNIDMRTFADGNPFQIFTPGDTKVEDIPGIPGGIISSWDERGLTWTTANAIGYPSRLFQSDWNNIGPRVGLSYMINNKTVIRGSYGEYYWTMPLSQILQSARTNPVFNLRFQKFIWEQPGNIDPTGDKFIYPLTNVPQESDLLENIVVNVEGVQPISSSPQSFMMFDGLNWKDAHARTWHITLEHELMKNTAVRFSYTGNMARDLEQRVSYNTPETEFNYVTRVGENYPTGRDVDPLRINKNWNPSLIGRDGKSNTHAGQVEVERRFSDGIGFQAFYVFTRSLTSTDAGGFTSGGVGVNSTGGALVPSFQELYHYPNPVGAYFSSTPSADELLNMAYFNSANIPPHRVRFNGIVDLPFGRGKPVGSDVSSAVNQIIGGWQVAFIGDWRSGFWSNVDTGRGVFKDYIIAPGDRPEVEIYGQRQTLWFAGDFNSSDCDGGDCSGLAKYVPDDRNQRAIHPYGEAFDNKIPIALNDGTTRLTNVFSGMYWPFARNTFMGPRDWNVDLSIFKNFFVTEDIKIRFTADFFNFFNHPNDPSPSASSGLVNHGTQTNSARTTQLSLRVDF